MNAREQANRLIAQVSGKLEAALGQLQLRPGDTHTIVHGGFPSCIVEVRTNPGGRVEQRRVSESPIRWVGQALRVEDPANGVHGASVLLDDGTDFIADVEGTGFNDGFCQVPGLRQSGGGVLIWEYTLNMELTEDSPGNLRVIFEKAVTLRSELQWEPSVLPTARVAVLDDNDSLEVVSASGVLRQLCATYDARGQVTIYQRFPGVAQAGSTPRANNLFFQMVA